MIKLTARQVRFLKRNEALTIIVGALLMCLTFVVDDVARERLRSLTDSLDAAQTTFIIRDSNLELYREIDELEARVAQGNSELMQRFPKLRNSQHVAIDPEAVLSHESVEVLRITDQTWHEFNNLGLLIAKMPAQDSRVREFNALYSEFDTERTGMLKPVTPIANRKDRTFDPIAYNQEQRQDYFAVFRIHDKLQMLSAGCMDDARSEVEKKEHLYKSLTPVKIFLFAIGVGLTVVTRLAGIRESRLDESETAE